MTNDDYKMTWKDKLGCAVFVLIALLFLACIVLLTSGSAGIR